MNSEAHISTSHIARTAFSPLKPKRRCKVDEPDAPESAPETYAPVLVNARAEFNRNRARISRSGRPHIQFRRVTPPSELMEILPNKSRTPLARVVDKIKTPRPRNTHQQGIWALLRGWVLAAW
jgi:hypothetical protein